MLILARKKGQWLNIGKNTRLVILEVAGETVRVGIEAPPEVEIYRTEVYEAILKENKEAMANQDMLKKLLDPPGQG